MPIACIAKGLTTDMLTYKGPHYEYENVPIALRPLQQPHPPFWYGSSGAEGSTWAGEEGLHFVTLGANQFAKTNLDTFKAAFAKRGGKAAQPKPEFSGGIALGVQRHIFVDETDEKAKAWAKPAMENHLGNINWIRNKHGVTMTAERMRNVRGQNFEECVAEGTVIAGSPKTVLAAIAEAAQGDRLQLSADLSLPRHHVGRDRDALAQAVHQRGDAGGGARCNHERRKRERIQPDKLHVRKDGDKVLYSQVMVVEVGGTRQIFVAGQTPRDRDGNCVGKGDMRAQIEQVGENIKAALEAAGATLADIVKTTTYVTDMDEYFKHQDMRMRYFARGAADQHHRSGGAAVAAGVHGRDRGVRDRVTRYSREAASSRRGSEPLSMTGAPGMTNDGCGR